MRSFDMLRTGVGIISVVRFLSDVIERKMKIPQTKDIYKPIDTVSIMVPSYNEEPFIEQCLKSIREQTIIQEYPQYFEIMLVDSGSKDKTVELAKQYVDKIVITPRGKLTARNLATDQTKGNIIVSVDSDSYYPPQWLNTLLEPFNNLYDTEYENDYVVGTVGSTFDDPPIPGVPRQIRNIAEAIDRYIYHPNQMVGRNSAYWKHAFYQSGRFDDINTNQLNVVTMVKEEEEGFGKRLSKLGTIVLKFDAMCVHLGSLKIGCRLGTVDKNLCIGYGIGIERFGN